MLLLLVWFLYSAAKWAIAEYRDTPEQEQQEEEAEKAEIYLLKEKIKAMYRTVEQIEKVENLMTDIETCEPNTLIRNFQLNWNGKQKYDFFADGDSDTTDRLHDLAETEYERLCSSLLEQIADLQDM